MATERPAKKSEATKLTKAEKLKLVPTRPRFVVKLHPRIDPEYTDSAEEMANFMFENGEFDDEITGLIYDETPLGGGLNR